MRAWKKGAVIGGIVGVIVSRFTSVAILLFIPDFVIVGAIVGYIYGRRCKR